jgi:hypothetical protein
LDIPNLIKLLSILVGRSKGFQQKKIGVFHG